jgi:collagenase-like PrtC family protease
MKPIIKYRGGKSKEIPQIIEMGVDSLKIEGRLKTEYYLCISKRDFT